MMSPIDSQNKIVHGHLAVGFNLNIEKGIEWMTEYTQDKLLSAIMEAYETLSKWTFHLMILPVNT